MRVVTPTDADGWDALTRLCFLPPFAQTEEDRAVRLAEARALLEAGADPNSGFLDRSHAPHESMQRVLYAAAAIHRDAALTALLLAFGADPNDDETTYHTPESYDNATLELLVHTGRLSAESLATLLLRKCDWHDLRGVRWLLEHGADPLDTTRWTHSILHHALSRENDLEILQLLLDYGADPQRMVEGTTAIACAARCGRGDVLDAMARRGIPLRVDGADALLAACARGHGAASRMIAESQPDALAQVRAMAGHVLPQFAAAGNAVGLRLLLDLGLPVDARRPAEFRYLDYASGGTALHSAAWRGRSAALRALLERGADVHLRDGDGRSALQLAVKACVDSHWTDRRDPEAVAALLDAGASAEDVRIPTGYAAIDGVLSGR